MQRPDRVAANFISHFKIARVQRGEAVAGAVRSDHAKFRHGAAQIKPALQWTTRSVTGLRDSYITSSLDRRSVINLKYRAVSIECLFTEQS